MPYHGLDVAHRYAPLPAGFSGEAWVEALCLHSASGHPDPSSYINYAHGSRWEGVMLVRRDEAAWDAWHDLSVLYELLQHERKANAPLDNSAWENGFGYHAPVETVAPLYRRLLRRLDDAVNAHDAGGLPALGVALRAIYTEFREDAPLLRGVLTGHAHLDLVWLWPEAAGEFKATHTWATALRTMERYPEFRFGFTQPACYQAVRRRAPQLLEQVRARIAAGNWEATGATYVESDTILACGEALARSFLVGQRAFADLRGGEPARVLWLPDVFGYSACLPQIMRETGVMGFFTTKLTWGKVTKFPFSSFVWLQTWEAARCVLGAGELEGRFWERLVFAQFHDYVPGSSIAEVYEAAHPELQNLAADALKSCAAELARTGCGEFALFNPLPLSRREIVTGVDGRARLVSLPPLAGRALAALAELPDVTPVRAGSGFLDNGRLRAEFDAGGRIVNLSVDGREVALADPAGGLMIYPDRPHGFDAWDVDRQTLSLGEAVTELTPGPVEGADSLEASLVFHSRLGRHSEITTRYRLRAGENVLRITHEIDWWEPRTLLKQWFPTRYAGRQARFAAPFGSVLRGQQTGRPQDEAHFEGVGSRWVSVGDDGEQEGLFVVTEARYGFTCREGAVGVSLLRNASMSEAQGLNAAEQADPRAHADSLRRKLTDVGTHVVRLAIGRFEPEAPREELPGALCDLLFTPAIPYVGRDTETILQALEGGPSLMPVWAKPAADGSAWILRLNETLGRRGVCRLRFADGWQARRTNLLETDGETSGAVTEIEFGPYQLISLRVSRQPDPTLADAPGYNRDQA